jgi:uncharacterized protein (DUF1499 family)
MSEHQKTIGNDPSTPHRTVSFIAVAGPALSVLSAVAAMLSGFGTRWGLWPFMTGFVVLKWAAYAALAGALASLAGALASMRGRLLPGLAWSAAGIVIGLAVAAVPWSTMQKAEKLPRIHDITTDAENPPRFQAVLPLRKNARNSPEYGGRKIAEQQRAAYPDIKPLFLTVPPAQAFGRALAAARSMGWLIVEADSSEGRIEATDTTFWFGFTDDIVVRVTPAPGGSRIDARSESRVGLSDIGANAARLRAFLRKLGSKG